MSITLNASTSSGFVQSADNSGEIELQSNGTTALKVNTNEGIQILNCLGVGNATPSTSGAGITFPATQSASSDANTLDDYEEGTWTPSVGGNATYATRYGRYVKVGKLVNVQFLIAINSIGTGSTNQLQGLPFATENIGSVQTGCISYFADIATNVTWLGIYAENNLTTCLFVSTSSSVPTVNNGTSVFKNGTNIYGSISYMT